MNENMMQGTANFFDDAHEDMYNWIFEFSELISYRILATSSNLREYCDKTVWLQNYLQL
jgi:hypothetical protein